MNKALHPAVAAMASHSGQGPGLGAWLPPRADVQQPVPLTRRGPDAADALLHRGGLPRHLQQCRAACGPWHVVGLLAHQVHAWVAPRFVTTLAIAAFTMALAVA